MSDLTFTTITAIATFENDGDLLPIGSKFPNKIQNKINQCK